MKQWKEIPLNVDGAVQPASLNFNLGKMLNEFNGNLNGLNLPVHSVASSHMQAPNAGLISSGAFDKFNVSLPSQAYHWTKVDNRNIGGTDIWTPLLRLNLLTDNWTKGWNRLSDYSPFTAWNVQFDAFEGSLVGCATIDWGHGTDMIRQTEGGLTFNKAAGYDWWTEWGVFVNDVLVARTGQIPPRRHTVQLPFNVPIGSQPVDVQLKFMTNNSIVIGVDNSHGTEVDVFSATCWVRNVYR
jgi:hypothetical protein